MTTSRLPGPTILLVEDDEDTRDALRRDLVGRGYRVEPAPDGQIALQRWEARRPDLVLLDLGLPDMDGLRILRRVRREAATPVVILSARGEEATKIAALEAGADDYVTKPFAIGELHARLRAVLRRAGGPSAAGAADGTLRAGPLVLDAVAHEVRVDGVRAELTPREFEILRVLLSHQGRLVTRGRLLRAVWGEAYQEEHHYLHVHVSQLRRRLAEADPRGRLRDLFVAEPGVGYRVRGPDGEAADAAPDDAAAQDAAAHDADLRDTPGGRRDDAVSTPTSGAPEPTPTSGAPEPAPDRPAPT